MAGAQAVVLNDLRLLVDNPAVLDFIEAPGVDLVVIRGHEFRPSQPLDHSLLKLAAKLAQQPRDSEGRGTPG